MHLQKPSTRLTNNGGELHLLLDKLRLLLSVSLPTISSASRLSQLTPADQSTVLEYLNTQMKY